MRCEDSDDWGIGSLRGVLAETVSWICSIAKRNNIYIYIVIHYLFKKLLQYVVTGDHAMYNIYGSEHSNTS